jgi:hypothetical protein
LSSFVPIPQEFDVSNFVLAISKYDSPHFHSIFIEASQEVVSNFANGSQFTDFICNFTTGLVVQIHTLPLLLSLN